MTATTVKVTLYRPGPLGDTVPATGTVECTPTLRRHVEGSTPPDKIVLAAPFVVDVGEPLYDTDGTTVLQPAEPGVAWLNLEPTDAGEYAGLWGWTFDGPLSLHGVYLVPTSASVVDFGDLVQVLPSSFDPIAPPGEAWQAALEAATEKWRHDLLLYLPPNALSDGSWSYVTGATPYGYSTAGNSATPYSYTYWAMVTPGTWVLDMVAVRSNTSGIITFEYSLDDGETWVPIAANQDMYNPTIAALQMASGPIEVETAGRLAIRVRSTGTKNPAALNYYALSSVGSLRRTA